MSVEQKPRFISKLLKNPPPQLDEEVASESHETRRIPDPYVFIAQGSQLLTPSGEVVENSIDKDSYLGRIELKAFQKIQDWSFLNDSGVAVWFSPPYLGRYPVSKIIISEISESYGTKVLFNRAVVLDRDANTLVRLANGLVGESAFANPEELRETPIFPNQDEFAKWFEDLTAYTSQVEMIKSSRDILIKLDTYVKISQLRLTYPIYERNRAYEDLRRVADSRGLIGEYVGSCPTLVMTGLSTPFEKFLIYSSPMGEKRILCCTCPFCNKLVEAEIFDGKIHCPAPPRGCGKSAPWQG